MCSNHSTLMHMYTCPVCLNCSYIFQWQRFYNLLIRKFFLIFNLNLPCSNLNPLLLVCRQKRIYNHFLYGNIFFFFLYLMISPLHHHFSKLQSYELSILLYIKVSKSLIIFVALSWPLSNLYACLEVQNQEENIELQVRPYWFSREWRNYFLWLAHSTSVNSRQQCLSFSCKNIAMLAYIQLHYIAW